MADDFRGLLEAAVKAGDVTKAVALIQETLDGGVDPMTIVDEALVPAIRTVGDLFEEGLLFLPHLMRSAEVMKKGMAILSPRIVESKKQKAPAATVIIGTVEGDIHDIGKNIVALLLSASGFDVVDLGASVSISRFIEAIESHPTGTVIVGMTSLLTTTMVQQKHLMAVLKERGLRDRVKVMVGGACVSADWAKEIGADGYGLNAQEAIRMAVRFSSNN